MYRTGTLALAAALMLAGCGSPETKPTLDSPPIVAPEAVTCGQATNIPQGMLVPETLLMALNADEHYINTTFNSAPTYHGAIGSWTVTTYTPSTGMFGHIAVTGSGIVQSSASCATVDPRLYMTALPASISIHSPAALQTAIATLNTGLPTPTIGDRVSYQLTMNPDSPIWQVTFFGNSTPQTVYIDAETNALTTVTPPLPFGLSQALLAAASTPGLVGPDHFLVEADAVERPHGQIQSFEMDHHSVHGAYAPPDLVPQDGKASTWVLVWRDSAARTTYPVVVTAGLLAFRGSDLPDFWSEADYQKMRIDLPVQDVDQIFQANPAYIPPYWMEYQLTVWPLYAEPHWSFSTAFKTSTIIEAHFGANTANRLN